MLNKTWHLAAFPCIWLFASYLQMERAESSKFLIRLMILLSSFTMRNRSHRSMLNLGNKQIMCLDSQRLWEVQSKVPPKLFVGQHYPSMFRVVQASSPVRYDFFFKSTIFFWEDIIKTWWHMFTQASFKYFWKIGQNDYRVIVMLNWSTSF